MRKNVNMEATGIAKPMINVRLRLPRKQSTTSIASVPPIRAEERTFLIEARMKKL